MQNRILNVLLVLTVTGILSSFWFYKKWQSVLVQPQETQPIHNSDLQHILSNNMVIQFDSESRSLAPSLALMDMAGQEVKIRDIIDDSLGPKLVFRFSETSCQFCIDQELEHIRQLWDLYGSDRIVLLADFRSFGSFRSYVRASGLKNAYYLPPMEALPVENLSKPYLFVLDKSLVTNMLFLPSKEMPDLSRNYYYMVFERFMNVGIPHVLN